MTHQLTFSFLLHVNSISYSHVDFIDSSLHTDFCESIWDNISSSIGQLP